MVMERLEKTFGLPPLSQVSKSLESLPDVEQLRQIKEVLVIAERVAKASPDLDKVVALIKEANSVSPERLQELLKVLRSIERILKNAPEGLIQFISGLKAE